jgi:hypothetical protein
MMNDGAAGKCEVGQMIVKLCQLMVGLRGTSEVRMAWVLTGSTARSRCYVRGGGQCDQGEHSSFKERVLLKIGFT